MEYYVLGGEGFIGSAVCNQMRQAGEECVAITRANYAQYVGKSCDVLVNCNGNARRFWANQNPVADLEASTVSTMRSLFDFRFRIYVYVSSVDVYEDTADPSRNGEASEIKLERLCPYGLHKWLSEVLVRSYAHEWLILRLGGMVGPNLKKNPVYDALNRRPLFISSESELGFVDTRNVACYMHSMISQRRINQVFNVCGTGTLRIGDLVILSPFPVVFEPEAERRVERYQIDNGKLRNLFAVPSSRDAVQHFIAEQVSKL